MPGPLRALIPEDSDQDEALLLRALAKHGYQVEHRRVDDAAGMRDALENESWDVILCDYSMPRFSALEALSITRELGLDTPFIVISGTIGEELAVAAMKAGAHDYLIKGQLSKLGETIERELGQAVVRRERRESLEKVGHLNRVLTALLAINHLIVQEKDLETLLRKAASLLVETRGYASAALVYSSGTGHTSFIARGGDRGEVVSTVARVESTAKLAACVQRTWESASATTLGCDSSACTDCPLHLAKAGQARLARALSHGGKHFGMASVVPPAGVAVDAEESQVFEQVASDIAFAIHAIESAKQERQSEARYRSLFEDAPVGIFKTTSTGRVESVNPAMARMLGFESVDHALSAYSDLGAQLYVSAERRDEFLRTLEASGHVEGFEYEARTIDGRTIWLNMSARVAERREDGTFSIEGFTREVTDRKQAERLFSVFMEHAPLLAFMKGADGRYLWANRSAEEASGGPLAGRPTGDGLVVGAGDVRADLLEQDRQVFECGTPVHASNVRLPLRTGERYLDVYKFPIPGPDGECILGAICIDVTERATQRSQISELEQKFHQSQKLETVGRLAGGVAHDFNNLLTIINSYATFVLQDLREADPMRADVEQILDAGNRAVALTRQLLAFSRKQVLELKVLDLNEVLLGMERMLRRLIGEDIELRTVLADKLGRVSADVGQIEQVVMNLAVNARDAMPRGGTLTLETRNAAPGSGRALHEGAAAAERGVVVAVTDEGTGMTAEVRERLFEPFFTTKPKGKGTGLGLATVWGIIQQSGGNVSVRSELGRGTTFEIWLPRVEAPKSETPKDAPEAKLSGTETVLVVEDENAVRELAVRILASAGYKVIAAANGGEALLVCEKRGEGIDLLLTDMVMPHMGGEELATRLKAVCPSLRVLYMSGYTDSTVFGRSATRGGLGFIEKPFTARALLAKVRIVLGDV